MLHPSYNDLMNVVNSDVEPGEHPVVNSRYSIVLATAKRARQLIAGSQPLVGGNYPQPLSVAIKELSTSAIKFDTEEEAQAKREAAALAASLATETTESAATEEEVQAEEEDSLQTEEEENIVSVSEENTAEEE